MIFFKFCECHRQSGIQLQLILISELTLSVVNTSERSKVGCACCGSLTSEMVALVPTWVPEVERDVTVLSLQPQKWACWCCYVYNSSHQAVTRDRCPHLLWSLCSQALLRDPNQARVPWEITQCASGCRNFQQPSASINIPCTSQLCLPHPSLSQPEWASEP